MKTLLITALLALAPIAHAEKWLETNNQRNGRIILLQAECKTIPAWRVMFSTAPNAKSLTGCWAFIAGEVQIRYDDGDLYSYPASIFRFVNDEATK